MSHKIIKDDVIARRLKGRLGTELNVQEPTILQADIIKTTSVDTLLDEVEIKRTTIDVVTGTGWVAGNTVPANRRWHIYAFEHERLTGSNVTLSGFRISNGTYTNYLYAPAAADTDVYWVVPGQPIIANAGWVIQSYVAVNQAAETADQRLLVREEYF